jgi:hypothetical protein
MSGAVIVHNLEHARAALSAAAELGVAVTLLSPPAAAAYLGAAVFRHMIAEAARDCPGLDYRAVLDCGGDPGLALGALREGIQVVRLKATEEVRAKVADIAAQSGAALDETTGPALDLAAVDDPGEALKAWLSP